MSVINRLSGALNLKPEERKSFRLLFTLSLITGIGLSYYFVAVNTFLIKKASVSNLPYAYIISGLGGVLLIKLYQYRQSKVGIAGSYRESILAFVLVAAGVFYAFAKFGGDEHYAIYLAYLGFLFNMPFTIIFALGFSAICGRLYNLAQSKRLLALVGTGEIIASIIGYLTAPIISSLTGSPDFLLPVAAICILPALIPVYKLSSGNKEKLQHLPQTGAKPRKLGLSFFSNEQFYLLIAVVSVFSVAAIYFVDYSYLVTVRFMAGYSGLEIATIVGFFFSLVKVGELVFSFLSGHILSVKGVKFSIMLLPLLLAGCFILAFAGGTIFSGEPVFILAFVFMAKFIERVIRKAISTPAIRVLYQVTGPDRLRIEATIEGVFNQVATVLAGGVLLIVSSALSGEKPLYFLSIISAICFIMFCGWSFVSLKLYDKYKKKIWSYLTEIRSQGKSKNNKRDLHIAMHAPSDEFAEILERALIAIENKGVPNLASLAIYSPSLLNHEGDEPAILAKKLSAAYYSNDNFFFRLALIRYMRSGKEKITVKMLREYGEISDLLLRLELVALFNKSGEKPGPADQFYFEDLCNKYSNELTYALSAQNDLKNIEDPELQFELKQHIDMITSLLFELLKVLYDASAIQVIHEIIISEDHQDIESRLFALELLDNTVNDEQKKHLSAVFEPAPFDQKIHRLQQFVPVDPMSAEEQLKDLMMRDFTIVNMQLKEACINAYYNLTHDIKVLNAFSNSAIRNLKGRADQLLNDTLRGKKEELLRKIADSYNLGSVQYSYLFNRGVFTAAEKKERGGLLAKNQEDNPYYINMDGVLIDGYALALLIDAQSGA